MRPLGGFHWERHSKYGGKPVVRCKLTLKKSISHQIRWWVWVFFNLPNKIRGWMQLNSEKKCPLASSKCLALHMNACLVWASWLYSEVVTQSGFTHSFPCRVFHQCPVCSSPLSVLGQSLISEFPSHHPDSHCLFHFFHLLIGVFWVFLGGFLPIIMTELLYCSHSFLIDLPTHNLASPFVSSLSSWAEAARDNSGLQFPCVFCWHIQDRK